MPLFVYILRLNDGRRYVGHSNNPPRRHSEHERGKGCRTTGIFGAGETIFVEEHPDHPSAAQREHQLKGWTRAKKLALAAGALLEGYEQPERIRPQERSEMLRSLSALFGDGCASFCEALGLCPGGRRVDAANLVTVLRRAKVFAEDPEEKKIQVLLHNLACRYPDAGIDAACKPAVDYHIMRLYVRRGDVSARTKIAEEFLFGQGPRQATTVTALRSVVADALSGVSGLTGIQLQKVNAIEWWIGRSVCMRTPDCSLHGARSSWLRPHYSCCPFQGMCYGYNCDQRLLAIREPKHEGRHY